MAKLEHLISLIFKTRRIIQERIHGPGRFDPFSLLRLETLRYVKEKGAPSMKEVADYLSITPPSATSLVDCLVEAKQLSRVFDRRDRRIVRLVITPLGKKTLEKEFKNKIKKMKNLFSQLSSKEINELSQILEKISKSQPGK